MQSQWKNRMQEMLNICQEELKKTTEIGKKMINASKASTELHETYELLGHHVLKAIKDGSLEWEDIEAQRLVKLIEKKESALEEMEGEVRDIKNKI